MSGEVDEETGEMSGEEAEEEEAVAAALPPGGELDGVSDEDTPGPAQGAGPARPRTPVGEFEVESSSSSEDEGERDTFEQQWAAIQDAQVGAARHGQRQALRGFSDELFELKESMPDETFRKLSNALKRRHDEI
jgi:hypothetical protein